MKFLLLALSSLALISCATTDPTNSGFLSNSEELKQDGKDLRFRKAGFQSSAIKQVYIAPVELKTDGSKLPADLQSELKSHYQEALATAFSQKYSVVSKPSSRAFTVRSAITKLDTVNVATNAVLSIVAVPVDTGGASVETELLKNSERHYAEARSVAGGLTGSGNFASKTLGYLSKTKHTKVALTTIANDLVAQISRQ